MRNIIHLKTFFSFTLVFCGGKNISTSIKEPEPHFFGQSQSRSRLKKNKEQEPEKNCWFPEPCPI